MKRAFIRLILVALFPLLPAHAQKVTPRFKAIEVRHFDQAEGVEIPPEVPDFLYAVLRHELEKSGMFEKVVGEEEVLERAEGEGSLILHGTLLEDGRRGTVRVRVTVRRRTNNEAIFDQELKVGATPDFLAPSLARKVAKEFEKGLRA